MPMPAGADGSDEGIRGKEMGEAVTAPGDKDAEEERLAKFGVSR